jgi:hypothetical protein
MAETVLGSDLSSRSGRLRGEVMKAPDEVAAMVRLRALGWGVRRIAAAFGCSHMTVRRLPGGGRLGGVSGAAAGQGARRP